MTGASFTCRGALIYNATQDNKSVAVLDFGNHPFQFVPPTSTTNSAIVRIS